MRPATALRRGLYVLCALYFILWACGPALSGPPPVPMAEGKQDEIGISPHIGAAFRSDSPPSIACSSPLLPNCAGPSGQLWYRHRADHFDVGGVLFGGAPTLIGGGALFRWRFYERTGLITALQADGGFLWASVGLPISWAFTDQTWLTLHPQAAFKLWAPLRLDAQLTHTTRSGLLLGLEAGLGTSLQEGYNTIDAGAHLGVQF